MQNGVIQWLCCKEKVTKDRKRCKDGVQARSKGLIQFLAQAKSFI